jgi:hypothetical protein
MRNVRSHVERERDALRRIRFAAERAVGGPVWVHIPERTDHAPRSRQPKKRQRNSIPCQLPCSQVIAHFSAL